MMATIEEELSAKWKRRDELLASLPEEYKGIGGDLMIVGLEIGGLLEDRRDIARRQLRYWQEDNRHKQTVKPLLLRSRRKLKCVT